MDTTRPASGLSPHASRMRSKAASWAARVPIWGRGEVKADLSDECIARDKSCGLLDHQGVFVDPPGVQTCANADIVARRELFSGGERICGRYGRAERGDAHAFELGCYLGAVCHAVQVAVHVHEVPRAMFTAVRACVKGSFIEKNAPNRAQFSTFLPFSSTVYTQSVRAHSCASAPFASKSALLRSVMHGECGGDVVARAKTRNMS